MKQFYETYKDKPELSKLLRENTWSNNLHINLHSAALRRHK
ncbi:hypothetical protein [Roseburia inulinivorans]|nr:hypothetical protein [Roseburia inulinivorans]